MSMQDPISDMLTCIRNSQLSKKKKVFTYYSKLKESILDVLYIEGFIKKYSFLNDCNKRKIIIFLKYFLNNPVISKITRVSRPGLRVYKSCISLPLVMSGLGIAIISTSKGILSDKKARVLNVGGEIICYVS